MKPLNRGRTPTYHHEVASEAAEDVKRLETRIGYTRLRLAAQKRRLAQLDAPAPAPAGSDTSFRKHAMKLVTGHEPNTLGELYRILQVGAEAKRRADEFPVPSLRNGRSAREWMLKPYDIARAKMARLLADPARVMRLIEELRDGR